MLQVTSFLRKKIESDVSDIDLVGEGAGERSSKAPSMDENRWGLARCGRGTEKVEGRRGEGDKICL